MRAATYVRSRRILALLPVALACLFSMDALATDQVRWKNSLSIQANKAINISVSYENRFNEMTVFDNRFLLAYYLTATYSAASGWYSALGIRRQDTDLNSNITNENRVYVQGGRKNQVGDRLALDTRFRIEYRSCEQKFLDDYFRFRIRLKLRFDAVLAGVTLSPVVSDELFADDRAGAGAFLNRNRIFAGIAVPVGAHVGCEVSHMLEQNSGSKPVMALAIALQLDF